MLPREAVGPQEQLENLDTSKVDFGSRLLSADDVKELLHSEAGFQATGPTKTPGRMGLSEKAPATLHRSLQTLGAPLLPCPSPRRSDDERIALVSSPVTYALWLSMDSCSILECWASSLVIRQ